MLVFNSVCIYVPYLVSKNEMILKNIFLVIAYTVDGRMGGPTDTDRRTAQYHNMSNL